MFSGNPTSLLAHDLPCLTGHPHCLTWALISHLGHSPALDAFHPSQVGTPHSQPSCLSPRFSVLLMILGLNHSGRRRPLLCMYCSQNKKS